MRKFYTDCTAKPRARRYVPSRRTDPLPCGRHLAKEVMTARIATLVADIEAERLYTA